VDSVIDRLNPLTKLIFVLCFIAAVFLTTNLTSLLGAFVFCVFLVTLSRVGKTFYYYLIGIVLILVLFLFIMWTLFYPDNSTILVKVFGLPLYKEGIVYASTVSLRIICLVSVLLLFIMTTKPKKLVNALLQKGMSSKFAYLVLSTLQIAPQMSRKSYHIREAQMSRGLKMTGNIVTRFKAYIPLLAPLISGSLSEVEERALALETRGFNSTVPKTSIVVVEDTKKDRTLRYLFIILTVLYAVWELIR
jgi:energy-coupling factor transporter transmembrane protein EcfT